MNVHAPAWWSVLVLLAGCAGSQPAPVSPEVPLALTAMDGQRLELDAGLARGETVALVFWQTWCAPCAREAPQVVEALRAHGERIRFVGVVPGRDADVDDAEVRRVAARWGYDAFPQVRDRDLRLIDGLGVAGTPTLLVLGRDRQVLYRGHRPPERWDEYHGAAPAPSAECQDGVCPLPGR